MRPCFKQGEGRKPVTLVYRPVRAALARKQEYSARYFCQRKAEEGGDAGASLTDDNAAMAEIAGAVFTVISAMLY